MMNTQQIEAWPVSQIQTPTSPAHFPSEEELRRELDDAIDRRRAADTRAKAAKVIADKAEALMCAAGEKVAYGLSRACPLRPKSRRKGEARLGPIAAVCTAGVTTAAFGSRSGR